MKVKELSNKSKEELAQTLKQLRDKLGQMKFDLAAGKVKNIRQIKDTKKDIARALTLLNIKHEHKA